MNLDLDIALRNLSVAQEEVHKQLVAAQLVHWPDSRIMSYDEVIDEWLNFSNIKGLQSFDDWKKDPENVLWLRDLDDKPNEWLTRYAFRDYINDRRDRYKSQMNVSVNCANQYQVVVWYECGKNEDGTYRHRGARYGVEGSEYLSGFPEP